jgi:hypothetical protein
MQEFFRLEEVGPLIVPREGDRNLTVFQRLLYGGLDREDFAQGQLLCALPGEATISA